MIAEEEAAKFLILMDAIRCPRLPGERFSRQLARFGDHLAKGLYARVCGMRPTTLEQLQEYVNNDREDFYLDGPSDVDWIFRNQVIEGREGTLYVDYVAHDDDHRWSDPTQFEDLYFSTSEPWAVRTARSLHDAGVSTPAALAVVAEVWRPSPPAADTHVSVMLQMNHRTLDVMNARGLLNEQPQDTYGWIVREWQFPMYDLHLTKIAVDLDVLRERQRDWSPDWY